MCKSDRLLVSNLMKPIFAQIAIGDVTETPAQGLLTQQVFHHLPLYDTYQHTGTFNPSGKTDIMFVTSVWVHS